MISMGGPYMSEALDIRLDKKTEREGGFDQQRVASEERR